MDKDALRPGLLMQHKQTLLKVSNVYDRTFTATVLWEPGRGRLAKTAVRTYMLDAVMDCHDPSTQILNKYEDTYGQRAEQ